MFWQGASRQESRRSPILIPTMTPYPHQNDITLATTVPFKMMMILTMLLTPRRCKEIYHTFQVLAAPMNRTCRP